MQSFENFSDVTKLFTAGITKGGNWKYHCTIDLLFDWFGISCMTIDNFCFYLQNRLIQTNQTGDQWYSGASFFSFPCCSYQRPISKVENLAKVLSRLLKVCPCTHHGILKGEVSLSWNTKGGSITVLLTSCLTGLD